MLLGGLGAPPSLANDLHFNVRRLESRMLLKGVTMINHLKSKILITGRNFCYLKSPLVARKKKKKLSQVILLQKQRGGRNGVGRLSCCSEMGWGAGSHPGKRPGQGQDGPCHGAGAKRKRCFSEVWGLLRGGGARARTYRLPPSHPPTPNLRAELESHLWVPLEDPSGHGSW